MRIKLASVVVENQESALTFYTEVLGFVKKEDIPIGEFRWLTVVSPDGPSDLELALEPNQNPASKVYQAALFEQGIPATAFASEDVHREYEHLSAQGVEFHTPPTPAGPTTIATFNDTCGNLIQIYEE